MCWRVGPFMMCRGTSRTRPVRTSEAARGGPCVDRHWLDAQRALQSREGAGPGGYGGGLPRHRPGAGSVRGHQDAQGPGRRRRGRQADPPGSPDPRAAGAPEYRAALRLRQVGGDILPRDGGGRRHELLTALADPVAGRPVARDRRGGGGPRLRPPPGSDPPRREAGQRAPDGPRRGPALRLRAVDDGRVARRDGCGPGHAALHESGARPGQASRPPDRPVRGGRDALRVRHRVRALPGAIAGGDRAAHRGSPHAPAVQEPGRRSRTGGLDPRPAGEGPGGSAGLGPGGGGGAAGAVREGTRSRRGCRRERLDRDPRASADDRADPPPGSALDHPWSDRHTTGLPTGSRGRSRASACGSTSACGCAGTGTCASACGSASRLAAGPGDVRRRAGRAPDPLARRALPVRPLPGLPARRRAAAGVLPPPSQRPPQRRPRTALAGDGLAHDGWRERGPHRPRRRAAREGARRPPGAQPGGRGQVSGQPRHAGQVQGLPRCPAAAPRGLSLCPEAHDDPARRAQPRPDPADARRPPQGRPGARRGRRPAGRALESRQRGLAVERRLPPGRAPLRDERRPPRLGQRRALARGGLPVDRARPLAA